MKTNLLDVLFCSEPTRETASSPTPQGPGNGRTLALVTAPINPDPFGRIKRDESGIHRDRPLNVNGNLLQAVRKLDLCYWHYLRGDCTQEFKGCKKDHRYPRPLPLETFDALWLLARSGLCYRVRKGSICEDEKCIYGHVI
jgi:hypothetical protein